MYREQVWADFNRATAAVPQAVTGERLAGLREEYDVPDAPPPSASSSSAGKFGDRQDVLSVPEFPGASATSTGTATGPAGNTTTRQDTWTKDGNTVTKDATYTGPKGNTAEQDVTWKKDGSTVTRDGETTTSTGKSVTSHDQWEKDGNTVQHDGTSTTGSGKTATREDTWKRDGNTVAHEGTTTGDRSAARSWKPNYSDDHDIFGGREKPKASAGHRGGGRR